MSDAIQHIDVDADEFLDAPKALRDHVKKLQSAITSRDEKIGDLTGRLTAQALNGVLSEAGFKNPERVKRDLLSDKVDPLDNEAVTKWLEANSDDYARTERQTTEQQDQSGLDPAEKAAFEAFNRFSSEIKSPADVSKLKSVQSQVTKETTADELIGMFRANGL